MFDLEGSIVPIGSNRSEFKDRGPEGEKMVVDVAYLQELILLLW